MIAKVLTSLGLIASVVAGAYAVDLVYVRQADHDQFVAQAAQVDTQLLKQLQSQERRALRREIRQFQAVQDTRTLTPSEKTYLRELKDQLEEIK